MNPFSRGPGRRKSLNGLVLAVLALFASAPSRAFDLRVEDTRPGIRLSAGIDVYWSPGSVVATARYGGTWGAKLGYWVHNVSDRGTPARLLVGADYMLTLWKKIRGGFGVAWIDGENYVNGTRWNFDTTLAYDLSDEVFVEYRHQSHGTIFGIRRNAANDGWNLVGLGYTF